MIYSNYVKFTLFLTLLVYLCTIRLNYQLEVNNYLYWKFGNFLVDSRYNYCLLSLFFLLKNKYLGLFVYFMLDELLWLDLNVTNNIKSFATLTNGFFVIHPLIILLSFSLLVTILVKNKNNYVYNIVMKNTKRIYSNLLALLFSGMYLGAYWANQEVGWGGWWSWDYVENINLILFLFILLSVHKKNKNKSINLFYNKKISALLIIFLHLCVRLDLGDSIHSFIQTNEIEYVYLLVFTLNLFIIINSLQSISRFNKINIINVSYIFILLLLILLSIWYLLYIQNYNHKILFIFMFMLLMLYILINNNDLNCLAIDSYFFISIQLFKVFDNSKNLKVILTHFIFFTIMVVLSVNYLELTIYYTKKNTSIHNILYPGDFLYNIKVAGLDNNHNNWYNNNFINSNWRFFFFNEIFFYRYLYEFTNVLTSDSTFLSYAGNTFQIYIYSIYFYIFLIKNTSVYYKYKRLCI